MKDNLTRRGSIAVIAALGVLASLGSASAANAQELSPGCQALNNPSHDALDEPETGSATAATFAAGDRITFIAREPSSGNPTRLTLSIEDSPFRHIEEADFPGAVEITIPYDGGFIVRWGVSDAIGFTVAATYEVGCISTFPDCSGVIASPGVLKADGKLQQVALSGETDIDDEALSYSISRVTQDEPTTGGFRNDLKTPDAGGVSAGTVSVRGERNPSLNGRVYRVHYTVTDSSGFKCSSFATVGVPARKGVTPVDDGTQASWNSFTGALIQ